MDDAYVYKMKCTFVEAKHLGCYRQPATQRSNVEDPPAIKYLYLFALALFVDFRDP